MNTWETGRYGLGARAIVTHPATPAPCQETGLSNDGDIWFPQGTPSSKRKKGTHAPGPETHASTYTLDTLRGARGAHLGEGGTAPEAASKHLHSGLTWRGGAQGRSRGGRAVPLGLTWRRTAGCSRSCPGGCHGQCWRGRRRRSEPLRDSQAEGWRCAAWRWWGVVTENPKHGGDCGTGQLLDTDYPHSMTLMARKC